MVRHQRLSSSSPVPSLSSLPSSAVSLSAERLNDDVLVCILRFFSPFDLSTACHLSHRLHRLTSLPSSSLSLLWRALLAFHLHLPLPLLFQHLHPTPITPLSYRLLLSFTTPWPQGFSPNAMVVTRGHPHEMWVERDWAEEDIWFDHEKTMRAVKEEEERKGEEEKKTEGEEGPVTGMDVEGEMKGQGDLPRDGEGEEGMEEDEEEGEEGVEGEGEEGEEEEDEEWREMEEDDDDGEDEDDEEVDSDDGEEGDEDGNGEILQFAEFLHRAADGEGGADETVAPTEADAEVKANEVEGEEKEGEGQRAEQVAEEVAEEAKDEEEVEVLPGVGRQLNARLAVLLRDPVTAANAQRFIDAVHLSMRAQREEAERERRREQQRIVDLNSSFVNIGGCMDSDEDIQRSHRREQRARRRRERTFRRWIDGQRRARVEDEEEEGKEEEEEEKEEEICSRVRYSNNTQGESLPSHTDRTSIDTQESSPSPPTHSRCSITSLIVVPSPPALFTAPSSVSVCCSQ